MPNTGELLNAEPGPRISTRMSSSLYQRLKEPSKVPGKKEGVLQVFIGLRKTQKGTQALPIAPHAGKFRMTKGRKLCRIYVAIGTSEGTPNPGNGLWHILIGFGRDKGGSSLPF